MEALYQNVRFISTEMNTKPKVFFKYFPKQVFGSECKNDYYHTKERLYALKEFKWVQYNSDDRFRVLSVDIDNSSDSLMYQDFNLPQPTWIIQTDKGFQYHWALKQDIQLKTASSKKSIKLIKDILNKLVALLNGDINAIGINRVFRNPVTNRSWFSGNEIELKEFYDLPTPKEDFFNNWKYESKIIYNIKLWKKHKYDFFNLENSYFFLNTEEDFHLFKTFLENEYKENTKSQTPEFIESRVVNIYEEFLMNYNPMEEKEKILKALKEVLEKLENSKYDLILMDLQMPILDGYETTKQIRSMDKYNSLPIIGLSAHAIAGIKEEVEKVGMNDYVSKPINPKEIFKIISLKKRIIILMFLLTR